MKIRILALATVATIALAGQASAGQGWYLGLGAGWASHQKVDWVTVGSSGTSRYKGAGEFSLSGGYKWDNGLRLEVEGNYGEFGGKSLTKLLPLPVATVAMTGHLRETTLLANLAWDIAISDHWAIELGGGAGWGWATPKLAVPGSLITGSDSAFAWQLMGGLNWSLSDNVDLGLDYRWRSIGETNHMRSVAIPFDFDKKDSQAVMLTLRWFPHHDEPPPPAPMPPPPAPMPPPPVKTFIVFFDFDKSNLTAEAQAVVTEAVAAAKTNGWVKVVVTGHTDTVGSDGYNQQLSERRAESVKDEMVRQGIAADGVTTQGKSFHDPLVPTGPGVREPQNRRAVIEY